MIDRPDEERRVISFNRLRLTDLKIEIPRLAAKKVLAQAFADGGTFHRIHVAYTKILAFVSASLKEERPIQCNKDARRLHLGLLESI